MDDNQSNDLAKADRCNRPLTSWRAAALWRLCRATGSIFNLYLPGARSR